MVWWIDSDWYCFCRSKFFYHETSVDISRDRIFQTTSIIYNINSSSYDKFEIHCLTKSGVNVFNVDRTIHDEDFFQKIKKLIIESENLPVVFPEKYRNPITIAVTMAVTEPVDIDERVDVVILKDVENSKELLDFKNTLKKPYVPVLLWLKSWYMADLKSMIRASSGVFLDVNSPGEDYVEVLQLSKQNYKSTFLVMDDIITDYKSIPAHDLKVFAIANDIIKDEFDGVILNGNYNKEKNESQLLRSLVKAMDVTENETTPDIYKLSFMVKTPVLPWISISQAASLAAYHSGASVIIVLTTSGMSARWIANSSTSCHILAVTTRRKIARQLHLYRKVVPLLYNQPYAANWSHEYSNRVDFGTSVALEIGLCVYGARVVVLAPSNPDIKYCNSLQIITIPFKCEE